MYVNSAGLNCNLPTELMRNLPSRIPEKELEVPYNISSERDQEDPMNIQGQEDQSPEQPLAWVLGGLYPFNSLLTPSNLAMEYETRLYDLRKEIVGIILPYPHGFDNEPLMGVTRSGLKFLHLFNLGNTEKSVSGTVEGIMFTNIYIFPKKRIVLNHPLDI